MHWGRNAARAIQIGLWVLGAVCLATLSGCGGGVGELRGTVTFQDKPLHTGTVSVQAADGSILSGVIEDGGTYTVTSIPAGPAKLTVNSPNPTTVKVAERKKGVKGEPKPAKPDASKWVAIPDKYADFDQSELTFEVKAGSNRHDIRLR